MDPHAVIAERRAEREGLLDRARRFAKALDPALGLRAVVVFGSAARGDFHAHSDVDVLVVADNLPSRPLDRPGALGDVPTRVQPVPWTPHDWTRQRARRDPITTEAVGRGVWLLGSPEALDAIADA